MANDFYGTQTMSVPFLLTSPREDSQTAIRTTGSGFADWGALIGFNLLGASDSDRQAYSVAGYTGIKFWARRGASYPSTVYVGIVQENTAETIYGGTCVPTYYYDCNDHYERSITVGTTWAEYTLPFSTFYQAGWGVTASRDLAHVLAFQFLIKYSQSYYSFDLQLDDVRLY